MVSLLLIFVGGCQRMPRWNSLFWRHRGVECVPVSEPCYSVFVSPLFAAQPPRRVLILESGNTPGKYLETQKLITEFASQMRQRGIFEVVAPPGEQLFVHSDNILQGQFDEREIARLSRLYNADSIAMVRINEFRAFSPMRASVTMAVVNSNESVVTFAIDGTWDTTRPATQNEFGRYVCASSNLPADSEEAQSIYLQSPTRLLAFTASQVIEALNSIQARGGSQ